MKQSTDTIPDIQGHLYQTYAPVARQVCSRILYPVGAPEDVEELVQDVMYQLLAHPEKYDQERASLGTYVAVMARSRALSRRKQLSGTRTVPMEGVLELGYEDNRALEQAEMRALVQSVLGQLKQKEQQLFAMRFLYHMSIVEIAGKLGISRRAADIRICRLRKRLEKIFAGHGLAVREYEQKEGQHDEI